MRPCADQHQQEKRLLTLDALGKYSLVDNYVLILFVVAFRLHLEVTANTGVDVYVTPVYGFFSFLFATCLSLMLGHAVLFFHRKTMQADCENTATSPEKTSILNHRFRTPSNDSSRKRLSCVIQWLILLLLMSTIGVLIKGFMQESYTFEIGGIAGMMLGDDARRKSYSVLSLGTALSSSVENPRSPSILFLQSTFFFFTVVTPVLCLILLLSLLAMPLTLQRQRYLLVAVEIANSWSAVEVFLLSILAALFQISTFASFMIGDKCDEVNIIARNIFDETDTETVCFSVDASVEKNCWYLLVAGIANFLLVSFCLSFAENAVDEKVADSCNERELSPQSESMPSTTRHGRRTFVQRLLRIPLLGCILFVAVPDYHPTSEEDPVPLEGDNDEN